MIFIFIIIVIILLYFIISYLITKERILKRFEKNNVIVYGSKGSGKDLLFQWVIKKRKKPYLSNVNYGYHFYDTSINDYCLKNNTFNNFVSNNINIEQKNDNYEGLDFYISDCGVYFPSQLDSTLHKIYPSYPINYALSRHLYNSNIHCNCQNLERVWKALREQADYYIKCLGVIKLPFILIIRLREYEKYQSAVNGALPLKKHLTNKFYKSEKKVYDATNGLIINSFVIIKKRDIKYDTRYFHFKIFGYRAPKRSKVSSSKRSEST